MHVKSTVSQGSMTVKRDIDKEKARFSAYMSAVENIKAKKGGEK
jgi:hypothetical protein